MRRSRSRSDRGSLADWAIAAAPSLVILCGHLVNGAWRGEISLLLVMLEGLLLAGVIAVSTTARSRLGQPLGLILPALLFLAVLGAAALSLSPTAPFERKEIWDTVREPRIPAIDRGGVILEMIKLGGLATVFLTGFVLSGSQGLTQKTMRLLGLSTGLFAVYAFFRFTADPLLEGNRLMVGFGTANTPATLFGVSTLLAIANLRISAEKNGGWRRSPDLLAWGSLAFSVISLLLTGSRSGLASTVTALIILGVLELVRNRGRLSLRTAAGVMAGVLVMGGLAAYSTRALLPRLEGLEMDQWIRETMVSQHWWAFKQSPLLGYGLGSFNDINSSITTPSNILALNGITSTHNVYVQWLEEAGLLGAIPMFSLIGTVFIAILWSGLTSGSPNALWQRTIACCLVIALMHGWTDFAFQTPSFAATIALALGVGYGLVGAHRRGRSKADRSRSEDADAVGASNWDRIG